MAGCQDRMILTRMALSWADVTNAAVAMIKVVPITKRARVQWRYLNEKRQ
jgi:hypothetical protein